MSELRYTLVSDGKTDRALIPHLTWLLREHGVEQAIQSEWADLWRLPVKTQGLAEKIIKSLELYPCDLLFVHRDAEREPLESRVAEIQTAVEEAGHITTVPPVICVVPVRMHEAWLLFDEAAIRRAAGNPNGRQQLNLLSPNRIEGLPDPKITLYDLLRRASGLSGHRLARLRVRTYATQVSAYIEDFSPLRALHAFNSLEADIENTVRNQGWASSHS
jgi:hypothetical protein